MRTMTCIRRWLAVGLLLAVSPACLAQVAETVTYYYTNQQGTPLATADASGNILTTSDYRPYGDQVLGAPAGGPGYTGHVNDPDSGLVYTQARYYDPAVGRFLGTDQVVPSPGNPLTFGRYAYAADNPVANVDADGRCVDGLTCDSMAKSIATHPDAFKALGPYAAGAAGIMPLPTVILGGDAAIAAVGGTAAKAAVAKVAAGAAETTGEGAAAASETATGEASSLVEANGQGFFSGSRYSSKVVEQMGKGAGEYHSFPESVTAFEENGSVSSITGGDGLPYQKLEIPGEYGSSSGSGGKGVFEFIKDESGKINHRLFVPDKAGPTE